MQADWIWGLAGGLVIGLGGAVFLLGNGRIMGASGIMGGLVDGTGRNTAAERLAFIAGVMLLPMVLMLFLPGKAATHLTSNAALIITAGLLVGAGTRVANGCTSGHGVCGISRFSLRGLTATVFYILAGGLTIAVLRHGLGVI